MATSTQREVRPEPGIRQRIATSACGPMRNVPDEVRAGLNGVEVAADQVQGGLDVPLCQVPALGAGHASDVALPHDPLDPLPVDYMTLAPQRGVPAWGAVDTTPLPVYLPYLLGRFALGALPLCDGWPPGQPGVARGARELHSSVETSTWALAGGSASVDLSHLTSGDTTS